MRMCKWRGLNVHVPKTRDAATFTDAAAEAMAWLRVERKKTRHSGRGATGPEP